jgi:hypothetical protein
MPVVLNKEFIRKSPISLPFLEFKPRENLIKVKENN